MNYLYVKSITGLHTLEIVLLPPDPPKESVLCMLINYHVGGEIGLDRFFPSYGLTVRTFV